MPQTRSNLVIVRAGDRSLHPAWTQSLQTREWDLLVSYFGSNPDCYRGPGERRIDDPGAKWSGLHALLSRDDFWRTYEYIWLPDDDLATVEPSINRLFLRSAELDLLLAQPALSWPSFYSHQITLRHPSFSVRFTDFVEIMAPCFKREFLEANLDLLGETQSGWGLDYILPRRQTRQAHGCAIVDDVEVTHTRPVGGPNYAALRGATAGIEGSALLARHGFARVDPPRVLAGITRDDRHLDGSIAEQASQLQELLAHDAAAFFAARSSVQTAQVSVAGTSPYTLGRWGW